MPVISRFFGIIIRIHWDDHPPPHFHAHYQGFEGLYNIKDGRRVGGSFPKRQERLVMEWAEQHTEELLESNKR